MKSTSNNASWVSSTFKQGSTESNWKQADVSFEEGFSNIALAQQTQTATSVKVLRDYQSVGQGDSIRLYNSTDGEVLTTAQIGSNSIPDGQVTFGTSVSPEPTYLYSNTTPTFQSVFGSTSNDIAGYTLYNEDGTKLYRLGKFTGGIKAWSLTTPYDPSGGMTYLGSTALTESQLPYTVTNSSQWYWAFNYLQGGKELVVWMSAEQSSAYYEIYTLATPYDPTTLSLKKSYTNTLIGTIAYNLIYEYYNGVGNSNASTYAANIRRYGISQIQFSADGTRAFIGRHGNNAQQMVYYGSVYFYSHHYFLNLAVPFDLSSANGIAIVQDNITGTSTTNFPEGVMLSNDGSTMYSTYRNSSNYYYLKAQVLDVGGWGGGISPTNSQVLQVSGSVPGGNICYATSNWGTSTQYAGEASPTLLHGGKRIGMYASQAYIHSNDPSSNQWVNGYIELDTSGDSLSAAPESVSTPNSTTASVSILSGSSETFDKIGKSFLVAPDSTTTSLTLIGDNQYGTDALTTGDPIQIDGAEATAGTVTKTSNYMSSTFTGYFGTPSVAPTASGITDLMRNAHSSGVNLARYDGQFNIGPQYFYSLDNSNYQSQSAFMFSPDGLTLYTNPYPNFAAAALKQLAKHTLSTPFNVGSAQYVGHTGQFTGDVPYALGSNTIDSHLNSVSFNEDGTRLNAISASSAGSANVIQSYPLSTPYDLSSGSTSDYSVMANNAVGLNYLMRHAWSDDGLICFLVNGYNSTYWFASNYTQNLYWARASTPFDIRTLSTAYYMGGGTGYTPDIVGAGTYETGYRVMRIGWGSTNGQNINVFNFSGDMVSASNTATVWQYSAWTTTYSGEPFSQLYSTNNGSYNNGFGLLRSAQGDKLYVFTSNTQGSVHQLSMPFGFFDDKYVVDVTSAGLLQPPTAVNHGSPAFTSLGSATKTSSANKNTYTYSAKAIDAQALRLKVTANSGADVSKVDVDLYT